MINVIVELSKYFITLLMVLYTLQCFTVFRYRNEKEKKHVLAKQLTLIFFLSLAAFTVIFLKTEDFEIVKFYLAIMAYFLAIQVLYRIFYKKASILLINNMCMLLSISFIMLSRLDMDKAKKQFFIVAVGSAVALLVPVMIRKMRFLVKLTWVYAGIGIALLGVVLVLAQVQGGAKLSIFGVQPSEIVKIVFVFFLASFLWKDSSFPQVAKATVIAGAHVLILVLSRDLGSALIFFVTYLVIVYVSTKKPAYFALGLAGGSLASVAAYFLFGHVRQRVSAWRNPFAEYESGGYQIAQSLFAIGTGGWFGMGLCQGSPKLIPVVAEDFMFGAICEELGGIFGICLILVCMSFFLMIVNISLQIKNPFYKLIALGLGTEYGTQVFLTIGGATKFIPMTGVTLPLVSYGGSSVMSTILLLAIVQGLYILREDEDEELEKTDRQQRRLQKQQEKQERRKHRSVNKEYAIISYLFVAIFVALAGYLIYFNGLKSEEFINSPYNTRQDTFADRVVRGKILAENGEVLAQTQVGEDGEETRVYPYGNVFAHVVGYDSHGKSGLESEANFQLLSSHAFFLEQMKQEFKGEKNTGDNVISTLNATLQETAYYALGSYQGAVVALDPQTGAVKAMVSKPDFDPNSIEWDWESLSQDADSSCLLNRATQGQYPPGSVFKIATALAYYREHGSLEGFSFQCEGSITMEEHTIQCYNGNVHGQEDLTSAFAASCNCAFAKMGVDLGGGALADVCGDLLFNKRLPLSMDYLQSSFSLNNRSGVPLTMQTSIGQGNTLVSPMHMAMVVSAIANDGVLMEPYLIDRVENYTQDLVKETSPQTDRRLISEEEARVLENLMVQVVQSGTAASLSGRGYTVAGKTGSAEYNDQGDSHSWFVGYSNVEDPDLVVAVIVEGGGTGSEVAVPVAGQIFDAYYYN